MILMKEMKTKAETKVVKTKAVEAEVRVSWNTISIPTKMELGSRL